MTAMTTKTTWDIKHLRRHLQYAVDLEFWTIPFYMSAMYSIVDPSDEAFQLIQSVVYQEMLHVQLAANVANAYGVDVKFKAPRYEPCNIPHLNFKLDKPDPTTTFNPWNSTIGPLDVERINAMCLIEYPEWGPVPKPELRQSAKRYGSIGEFYAAVRLGAGEHKKAIKGGRNQIDFFGRFYKDLDNMTVTKSGAAGFKQVEQLIDVIVEQGEGQSERHSEIPPEFRNTADDPAAVLDHFDKFVMIRDGGGLPAVFDASPKPRNAAQRRAQGILVHYFGLFRRTLEELFAGKRAEDFPVQMAKVGASIRNCWQSGVYPKYSK